MVLFFYHFLFVLLVLYVVLPLSECVDTEEEIVGRKQLRRLHMQHKHHQHVQKQNLRAAENSFAKPDKKSLISLYTEEVVLLFEALNV